MEYRKEVRWDLELTVWKLPNSLSFPSLKTLHIESLFFLYCEFMDKLFSGCPVLETFIIVNCGPRTTKDVTISANQLKHLEIDGLHAYHEYNYFEDKCTISISAPNLLSFSSRVDTYECSMEHCSSLEKATLWMEGSKPDHLLEKDLDCLTFRNKHLGYWTRRVLEIFGGHYSAKSLKLSAWVLEVCFFLFLFFSESVNIHLLVFVV